MIPELSNRIQGMDGGVSNFRISEEEEGAVSYNIYIYIYIFRDCICSRRMEDGIGRMKLEV